MKRMGAHRGFRARRALRWGLLASALLLVETAGPGDSWGYRFVGETYGHGGPYRAGSRFLTPPKFLWDREVWGPGETLTWHLVDFPAWGESAVKVRRAAEEALAQWSAVETADIRWNLKVISPDEDRRLGPAARIIPGDGYAMSIAPPNQHLGRTGCTVGVPGTQDELSLRNTLIHEFGHCLGLRHPPVVFFRTPSGLPSPSFGGPDAHMGYADPRELTLDDRVGASLLRPRPGWLAQTGTLWGNVLTGDGEPASWVFIVAARVREDGRMPEAVTRMTDLRGEFVIQGLDPGDYVLQARALRASPFYFVGSTGFLPIGPQPSAVFKHRHLRDTIRAAPVSVEAGAVAGPVTLVMQGNENWAGVKRRWR